MAEPLGTAVLELRTDASSLESGLKKAKATAEKGGRDLATVAKNMARDWARQMASMAAAAVTVTAAIKAISAAIDAARLAARFEQISAAFNNAARRMGDDGDRIVGSIRAAAGETISMLDAVTAASRAQLLGVPIDRLDELMRIARASARATGESVTFMFDSIVTGIGRASPMILDNLGLTLRIGEAVDAWAANLGKAADELTEAERKQAVLNAVLVSGQRIIQSVGGDFTTLTATERWDKLTAKVADLRREIGERLLPVVEDAVNALLAMFGALDQVDTLLAEAARSSIPSVTAEAQRLETLGFRRLTQAAQATTLNLQLMNQQLQALGREPIAGVPKTAEQLAAATARAAAAAAKFADERERAFQAEIAILRAINMSTEMLTAGGGEPPERGLEPPERGPGQMGFAEFRAGEFAGVGELQSKASALRDVFASIVGVGAQLVNMFAQAAGITASLNIPLLLLKLVFEGMWQILGPLVTEILAPLAGIFVVIGRLLGTVLAPVFRLLADVSRALASGFVWFFNKVLRPIGNLLITLFTFVSIVIAGFMNALFGLIRIITFGLINIKPVPVPKLGQNLLGELTLDQVTQAGAGAITSPTVGAGGAGATFQQQRPIAVTINVQDNQIFGGSLREFAILLRNEFLAIDVLGI